MGFQMTVWLTMLIYVQLLSGNIPVFESASGSPKILFFFVLNIVVLTLALLGLVQYCQILYPRTGLY